MLVKELIIKEIKQIKADKPNWTWVQIANFINEKYNTSYDSTTFNKWYLKEEDSISRVMIERKKNVLMKNELHKMSREMALKEEILEHALQITSLPEVTIRKGKSKDKDELIEIVISDLHYKGGPVETKHVCNVFNAAAEAIRENQVKGAEYRITFLGDDIEGMGAHESQLLESSYHAINQTIHIANLYSNGINRLFKEVPKGSAKSVVFVPYSNHGLAYGTMKARYQFPTNDYGMIIFEFLKKTLDEDIYIFEPDSDRFVVETPEAIYSHGHQGFHKNKNKLNEVLGVDKDIFQGHLHHTEIIEERNRTIAKFPTCRRQQVDYERMAGFQSTPQIAIVKTRKGKRTFGFIEVN